MSKGIPMRDFTNAYITISELCQSVNNVSSTPSQPTTCRPSWMISMSVSGRKGSSNNKQLTRIQPATVQPSEQGIDSLTSDTTTSYGPQRSFIPRHRCERSRSMAEFTSVSSTQIEHHSRSEVKEWSIPTKRQLKDFVQGICADIGVPVEQLSGNSSTNNLLPSVRTTKFWTKQKGD